ncbi:MAG: endonuclease IV, partial [Oscillospiraceae bacterium]|nr:endonuclease IV [Oscillospiraceae bacterium]
MLKIGCHLSSSGGFLAMGRAAESIGANVFQFFTRNPRGGAARALDEADIGAFRELAAERGLGYPLAHAPYTLNACA